MDTNVLIYAVNADSPHHAASKGVLDAAIEGPTVKGSDIFDAYIVAQMMAGGISLLCTYNKKGFLKFPGVLAQTPEEILANLGGPQEAP